MVRRAASAPSPAPGQQRRIVDASLTPRGLNLRYSDGDVTPRHGGGQAHQVGKASPTSTDATGSYDGCEQRVELASTAPTWSTEGWPRFSRSSRCCVYRVRTQSTRA